MKEKVLLIYMDVSTKTGILPYLSSIFSSYLIFDSMLADQIDHEKIKDYQMILFSFALCDSRARELVKDYGIPMYQCGRELNYTHIHKILEIPSHSAVCIVNDREDNCKEVLESLTALGLTQYRYTMYYPGGPDVDPTIQYAVTPGESRYVPSSIRTVIDIENRNVDMGTLCHIASNFHLPASLLNKVQENFANYISSFMRYINNQIEETMQFFLVRDKLLDTLKMGICITDCEGKILMANQTFCNSLKMNRSYVKGRLLSGVLGEWDIFVDLEQLLNGNVVSLGAGTERVYLYFSRTYETSYGNDKLLFLTEPASSILPPAASILSSGLEFPVGAKIPNNESSIFRLIAGDRQLSALFHTIISYAETDFPILILGEPGLYQPQVARFIHENSARANEPFLLFDAAESCQKLRRFMKTANDATIYINHLEHASMEVQSFLCSVLNIQDSQEFFQTSIKGKGPRFICSYHGNLQSGEILPELFYQLGTLTLNLPPLRELRGSIPYFYEYAFNNLFLSGVQKMETLFTDTMIQFLKEYEYPGNFREFRNLCRYFHCIFKGKKLTTAQLPSYIHYEPPMRETLAFLEREVLELIMGHPHSGRNKIIVLLSEKGIEVTSHQVRMILNDLAAKAYIQVMKTKQGCEITELGEYVLQSGTR